MIRRRVIASDVRAFGIALLAFGLALPLGTVLCVHDGGHASVEPAGFARCADDHDSATHDTSSHAPSSRDHGSKAPCIDTFVSAGELKTASLADSSLFLIAAAPAVATPLLPSIAVDRAALTFRTVSATFRWIVAFDAELRTTIALC